MLSKKVVIPVVTILLAFATACGNSESAIDSTTATPNPSAITTPTGTSTDGSTQSLSTGELRLLAANAFGEPGFHQVFAFTANLPSELSQREGFKLVLKLWDAGRPEQICSTQHPLSGCATVDWSDAVGRPGVPSGGVFDNRLTLQLTSGAETFFLSESGALNSQLDAFKPG